ncbi:hypothetical protein OE88DRAFT_1664255 [Heliocybe sulcata]|uniref:Uncharacterized protein n=1 Tax=Heliocybe sulcata TaxID=5364 RepID=A0A5C3MUJ4_9AGAM|nr:hypothetical protein OE88DRAFT_1664255 [Heliocybe sulcata]
MALSLGLLYGASFVGLTVSTFLYGITFGQVWVYYRNFKDDSVHVKVLVIFAFALDTCQQIMLVHYHWWYLVARCNGNFVNFFYDTWSVNFQVIPSEIIICLVQWFYILQLWRLGQRRTAKALVGRVIISGYILFPECLIADGGISDRARVLNWKVPVS